MSGRFKPGMHSVVRYASIRSRLSLLLVVLSTGSVAGPWAFGAGTLLAGGKELAAPLAALEPFKEEISAIWRNTSEPNWAENAATAGRVSGLLEKTKQIRAEILDGIKRNRIRPPELATLESPGWFLFLEAAGRDAFRLFEVEMRFHQARGETGPYLDACSAAMAVSRVFGRQPLGSTAAIPLNLERTVWRSVGDWLGSANLSSQELGLARERLSSMGGTSVRLENVLKGDIALYRRSVKELPDERLKRVFQNAPGDTVAEGELDRKELERDVVDFQLRCSRWLAQGFAKAKGEPEPRPRSLLLNNSLPCYGSIWRTELRTVVERDLTLLEAAFLKYRADRHKDPRSLEDLTESYLTKVPEDPFSGKPYLFEVTGDGYAIYSVGPDGKDDKGRSPLKPQPYRWDFPPEGDVARFIPFPPDRKPD